MPSFDDVLSMKRARSRSGRSFSIHPTPKLIENFARFAIGLKGLISSTFEFRDTIGNTEGFYFAASYMAARIPPYPSAMRQGLDLGRPMRRFVERGSNILDLAAPRERVAGALPHKA